MGSKMRVLLMEIAVAGVRHATNQRFIANLQYGEPVALVREHQNRHDQYAIRVEFSKIKIGYLPMTHSQIFAALIDSGMELWAEIDEVDARKWVICLKIFMQHPDPDEREKRRS